VGVIGNQFLPFNPLATSGKPRDAQRYNGDNATTVFTLNFPVNNPTDLEVFVDNVQQEPLTAYDAIGSQLIFTEAPPTGTNNVYVIYRNIEPGVYASIPDGAVTFNKLANNIRLFTTDNFVGDGGTIAFGLSSEVPDANTLMVTVDGVFQRAPIHYTATGNTITFTSAPPSSSNVHVRHLGFRTTSQITALPANTTISQPVLQNLTATGTSTFTGNVGISGTVTVPAGSNTAPAITTSGDTNTGIFFPAADTIALVEGGVEVLRVTNTGRVSIGTTASSSNFNVRGDGSLSSMRIQESASPSSDSFGDPGGDTFLIGASRVVVPANTATTIAQTTYGNKLVMVTTRGSSDGTRDIQYSALVVAAWSSTTLLFSNTYGGISPTISFSTTNGNLQLTHNDSSARTFYVRVLMHG
jgi:hypothetical protein